MARLWSSGFELQSLTDGVEWTSRTGFTVNGKTISTSIKHGGNASFRIQQSAGTTDYVAQGIPSGSQFYFRIYFYVASLPSANDNFLEFAESTTPIEVVGLQLNTDGKIAFRDNITASVIATTASAVIATGQWYRIEGFININAGTNLWHVTLKVDGSIVIDTDYTSPAGTGTVDEFIIGSLHVGTLNCDYYFDDTAINDTSGSNQNSYPGEGSIVHALPSADGDNHAWLKQGGGAGDANNYQSIDEVTPDDATTYLKRTSGQPIDDYNLQNGSDIGIGASDTITLVQVGARVGASSNTTNSARELTYRIKKTSGGTVATQANNLCNATAFVTHTVTIPRVYQLTRYTDPDGGAWTPTTIDSMQIGIQPDTSSTTEVRVSAIWALIEYVPVTTVSYTVQKSLKYTVIKAITAITKSLKYGVLKSYTATKSLQYAVRATSSAITKSLRYAVKSTQTLTKQLKYAVIAAPTTITKQLRYAIIKSVTLTKSLQYSVTTTASTIQKSLAYAVLTATTLQKSLQYAVRSAPSAITKAMQYAVISAQTVSKSLKYTVKTTPATIQKSLQYAVLKATTITKSLEYQLVTTHSYSIAKDLTYAILTTHSITKSLQYAVRPTGVIAKSLTYAIRTTSQITKSLVYAVTHPVAVTKSLTYAIVTEGVIQKSLAYAVIVAGRSITKTLTYAVSTASTLTKQLVYTVINIGAVQKSLQYAVRSVNTIQKEVKYTVVTTGVVTKTLSYRVYIRRGNISPIMTDRWTNPIGKVNGTPVTGDHHTTELQTLGSKSIL